MNQKTLTYLNKSMAFDYLIKGDQNKTKKLPLYIILHNGGISQPSYNNGEFLKARFRYQSCIQTGIICGVRGVTDLSNMHYSKESLILLDRLIKSFIVFYKADPDRVYLIGLGFGGDGVYQIINLLSSRFAAAVVISGHSYGKVLKNLLNVHLLIQVGENDTYFDKNKDAVKTYKRIKQHYENFKNKCKQLSKYSISNSSNKKNNNNFMSNIPSTSENKKNKNKNNTTNEKTCVECYIHTGQEQVINDFDKKFQEFPVIADPIEWMISDEVNESINVNTNSISFLNKFTRDPLPKNLFWDLTCTISIPITYPNKAKEFLN
jgi:TfoX/Sxy family transcriptional regulator of competence genes